LGHRHSSTTGPDNLPGNNKKEGRGGEILGGKGSQEKRRRFHLERKDQHGVKEERGMFFVLCLQRGRPRMKAFLKKGGGGLVLARAENRNCMLLRKGVSTDRKWKNQHDKASGRVS